AKVPSPARKNRDGRLIQAVAAVNMPNSTNGDVYGLYPASGTVPFTWEYLGSISVNVWSIASHDGNQIFLGTTDGRIFIMHADGSFEAMRMSPFISSNSTITKLLIQLT